MVYAPKSDDQLDVVLKIIKAATWFVSGGDEFKDGIGTRRDSGYGSAGRCTSP
jgi:hypothetical protein